MAYSFDLIIFKRERRLAAARISTDLSKIVFDQKSIKFQGLEYIGLRPFGEWLALCDDSNALVGLAVICIISSEIGKTAFLLAENALKDGDDYRVLFTGAKNSRLDGWPLSTVYILNNRSDGYILYVPNFYSAQQTVPLADGFAEELLDHP